MRKDLNWEDLLNDCVDFTQRLVQTPSMSHEEETIANLIAEEMNWLEFDEVWLDKIGNVYGRIHGTDREKGDAGVEQPYGSC